MTLTPENLITKYALIAQLPVDAVGLFLESSYQQHSRAVFSTEFAYDHAVELHTMMSIIASYPSIARELNRTKERVKSEEGDSREEYELGFGSGIANSLNFQSLYQAHIRKHVISTRIVPSHGRGYHRLT